MKVALIIDTWFPFIGGGQINAYEISKRVAEKGVEIDIITKNNGRTQLSLPKNLKVIKLGKYEKPNSLVSQLIFCFKAFFFIWQKNYDLIHAHAFYPGLVARLLMVTKGIPTIFTVHGTSIGTNLLNPFARVVEKFILTEILYSAQITVSQDFVNLKNINQKIFYIPNGINIKDFDRDKSKKLQQPNLIFVGRLHKQKNLTTLFKSIKEVSKRFADIRLEVVGNGPQRAELTKLAKSLRLSKNISFHGEVTGSALIRLYKSSHIFILPSIYEGQPLTLLEAWASKLPAIVTKTGDCQFLVKNGVNGFLINNPQDVNEIASLIAKALESKNLEKMGLAGYNLVAKNFSWEKSTQETLSVYEDLVKPKN